MKKLLLHSLLVILLFLQGCNEKNNYRDITITDFSKPQIFSLKPSDNKLYSTFIVDIKGNSNDSIAIFKNQYVKLNGKIDTVFNNDYYGGSDAVFYFYPYKASNGKLTVKLIIR